MLTNSERFAIIEQIRASDGDDPFWNWIARSLGLDWPSLRERIEAGDAEVWRAEQVAGQPPELRRLGRPCFECRVR